MDFATQNQHESPNMPLRRTALTVPVFDNSSTGAKLKTRPKLKPKSRLRTKSKPSLLSLPTNIRTKIFSHVLTFPRDIHIRQLPSGKYGVFITAPASGFTVNGSWMRFAKPDFSAHITTSLLLVNRQIYSEAKPILYGSNTFVAGVDWVFKCCPPSIQPHIKRIKIVGAWKSEFRNIVKAFENTADVVKLERLEFAIDMLTTQSAKKELPSLVAKLIPLLQMWKAKQQLSLEAVVGLVGFATGDDGYRGLTSQYNEKRLAAAEKWNEDLQKQVREQFEKATSDAFCMGRFLEVVRETQKKLQK